MCRIKVVFYIACLIISICFGSLGLLYYYRIWEAYSLDPQFMMSECPDRNDEPVSKEFIKVPRFEPGETSPDGRNIFFVETAQTYVFRGRELCAPESAANENPEAHVFFFVSSPFLSPTNVTLSLLSNTKVKIRYLDLDVFFKGTSFEGWYFRGLWKLGDPKTIPRHLSDAIRLTLLFKYGGTYLDNDTITLRSFRGLKNAIGVNKPNSKVFSNGAMVNFEPRNRFLKDVIALGSKEYDPFYWPTLGSTVMTKVYSLGDYSDSLNVTSHREFQPILPLHVCSTICNPFEKWSSSWAYFDPSKWDFVQQMIKNSFTTQTVDSASWRARVDKTTRQPIVLLAQRHCPTSITFSNVF